MLSMFIWTIKDAIALAIFGVVGLIILFKLFADWASRVRKW